MFAEVRDDLGDHVVDREREIEMFRPQEYWSVTAKMEHKGQGFDARLVRYKGEKLDKMALGKESSAEEARAAVEAADVRGLSAAARSRVEVAARAVRR